MMRIYVDLIFFLNFSFDFLLLMSVSLILKRNVHWFKIVLGSLVGSFSIFFLFFDTNALFLFILKFLTSILMILVTFAYKDRRYFFQNMLYLYMSSIVLGGFLYALNIQFSYKNDGLIFFHHGLGINFILLLIFSPIILYAYIRQCKSLKAHYSACHKVSIDLGQGKTLRFNGYLDTGNRLQDPYGKRPVTLIYSDKLQIPYEKALLVPFTTLNNKGLIACMKVEKMKVDDQVFTNILIGKSKEPFAIEGIDCILPSVYKEEIHD